MFIEVITYDPADPTGKPVSHETRNFANTRTHIWLIKHIAWVINNGYAVSMKKG